MPNNFAYTNNTPRANVNPSQDVTNMTQNTNSIEQIISVDHIGFNTNGSGIHKQVTLVNESAPGLGDGSGVLFANNPSGTTWPFWQNGSGTVQLIGGIPTIAQQGISYLPGGLILIWDKITSGLNTNNLTVNFPFGGFPNNCFSVQLTSAIDDNSTIRMAINSNVSISKTNFQTQQTASSHLKALYYLAIGN